MSNEMSGLRGYWRFFYSRWVTVRDSWQHLYWQTYFGLLDGPVGRYALPVTEARLRRYVDKADRHPHMAFVRGVKQFSMLHEEMLLLLHHFAASSRGGVLEVGTYVGGSTVVMAQALSLHHRAPLTAIEPGGSADHDLIPSQDIFGDLQGNVARYGLQAQVYLLQGFSGDAEIQAQVRARHGPKSIGVLVIDADGHVGRDIRLFEDLLKNGAVLVLDDYQSPGAPEKAVLIKNWVEQAVAGGRVTPLGVWGWGTWIGLYRGRV
jgi:predicted O-methyltransferase YrrM